MTALDGFTAGLDLLPEPMLLVEADGRLAHVNRAALHRLALSRDEVIGRRLVDVLADPAERVAEYLHACARSGQMVLGAVTLRANGALVEYRAHGFAHRAGDGTLTHTLLRLIPKRESVSAFVILNEKIVALNAEIERRRLAERDLARQNETLRVTLTSIGDAVIVTDPGGRVTFMNPVAESLTGRTLSASQGRPLAEVFPIINEASGEPVEDPVTKVLATGQIVGLANHTLLVRADGTRLPIDDSGAPIRRTDGTLFGVVLIFRDISARRQTERELREADRRKDEFLAILAHELRNPLAPIRNSMQIMRVARDDAATMAAARDIVDRQLSHLTRLIDDLLDISRITQGKFELRRERTALSGIIQMALEIVRPHLEGRNHPLQIELASDNLVLVADPARLGQVFANLLHNASKYSATGTPIRITATADGDAIIACVIDRGVGIPEKMREVIFEPFSQVQREATEGQGGLGIGLSLVRRILELHGGSVRAEANPDGVGSRFILRLPRASQSTGVTGAEPAVQRERAARTLRILVADDNRDAAQTLAMMLRLDGHEVREAYDGHEALAAGAALEPDLVLLDIGMPVMDGYQTARRMRAESWGRRAHIVALTGWGQDADRRKSFDAGFHDHLVKPADPDTLDAIIRRVANR